MNFEEVVALFERLAKANKKINGFSFGGKEEMLNEQRGEKEIYPQLNLAVPIPSYKDNRGDGIMVSWSFVYMLVAATDKDDFEGRKDTWHRLSDICNQLNLEIIKDSEAKLEDFTFTPVWATSSDNLYGWQVAGVLKDYTTLCRVDIVWN